jgi:general secretion pathway protein E/type IV pilus assembly protein PilB
MTEALQSSTTSSRQELLASMVERCQLSAMDAEALASEIASGVAQVESEEEALQWLAREYGLGYTALDKIEPDRALLGRFSARILLKEELLPLREQDGMVEVAVSRLFAAPGLDSLRALTDLKLQPVLAPSEALQREIKKHLGVGADTLNLLEQDESFQVVSDDREDSGDLDKAAEDASIIRFVNQVLGDAISLRASDIHVEPFEHELRIRYRIDGLLQEIPVPAQIKRFQPAIVSRIKILSNLNIAEKRVPQDGRIKIRVKASEVDIRVSVIRCCTARQSCCVLLRQDAGVIGLMVSAWRIASGRFSSGARDAARHRAGHRPDWQRQDHTLYSALHQINDERRKIITIEDPVEYQLKGINQIQVARRPA